MVPSNFTYSATKSTAQTGDFYRDGNYVYKIDDAEGHEGDLLLVADFSEEGGSLSVPEGVEGIQVGTYFNRTYEYFVLPSSFSYIGYNADAEILPSQGMLCSTIWTTLPTSCLTGKLP